MAKRLQLIGPKSPSIGLATSIDGAALPPGSWQLFENVRSPNGLYVEVRGGTEEIYAAPGSGTFKGGMIHPDLGAWAAIYESSKVRIYQNTGSGWTERTDVSTRFATNAWVTFAVVQAPRGAAPIAPYSTAKRYVVAQNGTDSPLVMAEDASVMSVHSAISVGNYQSYRAFAVYADYYAFALLDSGRAGSPNGLTYTATLADGVTAQTNFAWASVNAGTLQRYPQLTVATGVTYDDMANIANSVDTIDWSTKLQMHLLYEVPTGSIEAEDIWNQIKIVALDNSGNAATLYDPTDTSYAPPVVVQNDAGKYLAAFSLPNVTSRNYKTIRFQWKGATLSSGFTFNLYACLASTGNIDGGSSFAVSHLNPASFAESPSVVCATDATVNAAIYGAPALAGMTIPVTTGVGYAFQVNDPVTSGASGELRVIYMAAPGADEFYYVASSSSLSSQTQVTSGTQYGLVAPGGLHQVCPVGPVMKAMGSRLLVGGSALKDVWFSALSSPLRFRPFIEFVDGAPDIQGAGTIRVQGETVQAIEAMAGTYAGAESVLIWTDKALYRADGSDSFQLSRPRQVGNYGTVSGRSVASHNGIVFWLDAERQVRTFAGGFDTPSLLRIDSDLAAIPDARIGEVSGAIWKDTYYLAYTPSGSTNTKVFAWDLRGNGWSRYDAPTGTAAALGAGLFSSKRKLCVWTSAGRLLEYDKAGATDLGANVSVTMQSADVTNDHWDALTIKRVGVVCSTGSGSLTVTRPTRDNTATPTSATLSLSSTTPRESGGGLVWRYDSASDIQAATLKEWGASVKIEGQVAPGWKLLSLVADVESVDMGGADV